jgi:hypothetical protein
MKNTDFWEITSCSLLNVNRCCRETYSPPSKITASKHVAVVMRSSWVWGMVSRSPLKVNQPFVGTYRLHLEGRSKQWTSMKQVALLGSERSVDFQWNTELYIREDYLLPRVYPKRQLTLNRLHGIISQNIKLIHSVTMKFPNWRYYSNTTNSIYREWTGIVKEEVYLYDVKVSTCLVEAYEDYNCFGEVSFVVVSKVSKWNKEKGLIFCNIKEISYWNRTIRLILDFIYVLYIPDDE